MMGLWYRANRLYGMAMLTAGVAFFVLSAILGNWRPGEDNQKISLVVYARSAGARVLYTDACADTGAKVVPVLSRLALRLAGLRTPGPASGSPDKAFTPPSGRQARK
jgi:hypothetical protein